MMYIVKDIEEDLDFGCEERLEAAPKRAVAVLADETGKELRKKVPDQHLYDEGIEPGSRVYFDENNVIRKALSREHWTEEYSGMDIDVSGFIHDMEGIINGSKQKWVCPFCGGNVYLVSSEDGEHRIGCDGCDMTIDLGYSVRRGDDV